MQFFESCPESLWYPCGGHLSMQHSLEVAWSKIWPTSTKVERAADERPNSWFHFAYKYVIRSKRRQGYSHFRGQRVRGPAARY